MNWIDLRPLWNNTINFDEGRTKTVLKQNIGSEFVIQVKGTVIEREKTKHPNG
jgi:aspartyl-tRNA synthetase